MYLAPEFLPLYGQLESAERQHHTLQQRHPNQSTISTSSDLTSRMGKYPLCQEEGCQLVWRTDKPDNSRTPKHGAPAIVNINAVNSLVHPVNGIHEYVRQSIVLTHADLIGGTIVPPAMNDQIQCACSRQMDQPNSPNPNPQVIHEKGLGSEYHLKTHRPNASRNYSSGASKNR